MEKFIDENSKRPDISLWPIDVIDESLRRHIDWRANVDIFEFGPGDFCEPKICNFGLSIMNEDVGYFDISMYDAMVSQIEKSFIDSFDVGLSLFFFHDFFSS